MRKATDDELIEKWISLIKSRNQTDFEFFGQLGYIPTPEDAKEIDRVKVLLLDLGVVEQTTLADGMTVNYKVRDKFAEIVEAGGYVKYKRKIGVSAKVWYKRIWISARNNFWILFISVLSCLIAAYLIWRFIPWVLIVK